MSKIEYRAVTKFLSKEGFVPAAIKQRLDGVYSEASPSYSKVKEWAKQCHLGRVYSSVQNYFNKVLGSRG